MIHIKLFNKSSVSESTIAPFLSKLKDRLDSVDFSKFGIENYTMHIVINADNESVKIASALSKEGRYIFYQGIPQEYAYNSSFEAKLATIRLRIQNIEVSFESSIENIIFIIDFRRSSNSESEDNNRTADTNKTSAKRDTTVEGKSALDGLKVLFKKNVENEDERRKTSFIPTSPKYPLDKVIMNEDMAEQIEDALSIIRNRKKIYEEWGFDEVDPQPKAILSFWGPPGTGKTMCAHGIASAMNQKILAVNYAEIESKYAGESPKNLIAAFNVAQENNAILFFDEADSFLGKRISNVQSGHDQSINSLRSQMLILLEDFEGIVIFATNLVKNFDPAFETRILRHIKFDLPDVEARISIFKTLIPSKVPLEQMLEDEDYLLFAKESEGFSGRDIRNSILDTLSNAAKQGLKQIPKDLFIRSIDKRQETYKNLADEKTKDNKKIAEDIKASIIEKSKQDFNEALIGVALYAAWSDNKMDPTEEVLLKELCVSLNVKMPVGFDKEYLPPLSQIIEYFNTEEKKMKAIDLCIRIVAIDGAFVDEEIEFIEELCDRLRIHPDKKRQLIDYSYSLASLNSQWYKIK